MSDQNNLSGREIEILKLVATGLTNREIAQELTISPNTVKVHLRNIFDKISVASRTEATVYGIEHGLVDVPGGVEAAAAAPPTRQELLRKNAWWIIPLALLIIVLLVIATLYLLQPPAPETQALAELAERWQELAPMPAARAGMAAAAYDGQIYAIAGEGPEGISGSVFRYSPNTDTWAQLNDKPTPVADVHGALIGEKIYVPGGRGADGQPTDILEIYDPRRDAWTSGAPLPQALSAYALADFEGQMYLFGGWDGQQALDVVYVYDPGADAWREGTRMPTARYHAGAAEVDGKIYVIGGWAGDFPININESFNPERDRQNDIPWQSETSLPDDMNIFGIQEKAGLVFVFGLNDTEKQILVHLNMQTKTWSFVDENFPIQAVDSLGVTSLGQNIVLLGGTNSTEDFLDTHIQYKAIYTISIPIIIQ